MAGNEVDWIGDALKAGEELRTLIREAHEAARDLKQAKHDVEDCLKWSRKELEDLFDGRCEDIVRAGLAEYAVTIQKHIAAASDAIAKRFDTIADILMGKGGDYDLEALAVAFAKARTPGTPKGRG